MRWKSGGCRGAVRVVAAAAALALLPASAQASSMTVGHGRDTARIVRDTYGVPHVYGRTTNGMWFGAGYAQAQDRLVQMELVRRKVEGTLSEVFGSVELSDDQDARQEFYTPSELAVQYRSIPASMRRQMVAFSDGVNAYVRDTYRSSASRDRSVPFEYWTAGKLLGLDGPYKPGPWRPTDTVAIGDYLGREFGGGGGDELKNLEYLRYLEAKLGATAGRQVFDDSRWINDPTAPTTVPSGRADAPRPPRAHVSAAAGARLAAADRALGWLDSSSVHAAAAAFSAIDARREAAGERLKVPWKDGSNAFVVAPWRSRSGRALLWGAPQEGFDTPNIDVEAYLNGPGYHAGGMQIAGEPYILIGHNRDIAFTTTSEELVDQQIYAERTDFSGPVPRYRYKGAWRPMQVIHEQIKVHGQAPVGYPVYRTVHGPVIKLDRDHGVAYSERFASWKREQGTLEGFAEQGGDHTLAAYRRSISKIVTLHDFFYADRKGNIAFFGVGLVPILPKCRACDPRLPHNGDGSQEWRGFVPFRDMPHSINPRQGYLVNWNTKPDARHYYQQNGGDEYWGTIYRSDRIAQRIRGFGRHMTLRNALSVEHDIGTMDGDQTYRPTAHYFLPHLFRAYAALARIHDPLVDAASHPQLAQAIATLKGWDRHTALGRPAMSIYVQWVAALQRNLFGGGANSGERYVGAVNLSDTSVDGDDHRGMATYNLTWHILHGTRGIDPCNRLCYRGDYFSGQRYRILVESLDDAVAALSGTGKLRDNGDARGFGTTDVSKWGWIPYPDLNWDDLNPVAQIGGATTHLGRAPSQERSTYMQGIVANACMTSVNVLPPGQSGFLSKSGHPSPHFGDQVALFERFRYKPMRLELTGRCSGHATRTVRPPPAHGRG